MKKCSYCGFKFEEKLNNCPNCGREAVILIQNYNPDDPLNIKKTKRSSFFNILGKIFLFLLAFLFNLFFIILDSSRVYNDKGYWAWVDNFLSKFEWLATWAIPILAIILLSFLVSFILRLKKNGYLNFGEKFYKYLMDAPNSEEITIKPVQSYDQNDPLVIQRLQRNAFYDNLLKIFSILFYVGAVVLMYFIFRNAIISDSSSSPLQTSALLATLNEWSLRIGVIMGLLLFAIFLGWKKKK